VSSPPPVPPTRGAVWIHGARPRTLVASVAPVVVGTAAAGHAVPWRFVAALLVGLGLQVGVNYANDFHDGVRGVDTHERLGPPRLTSSGMASPRSVMLASLVCILVAGVAGLALALATTLWLIPLGAVAMLALWLYSGGPRPYAELGLGEVMVFLFFGVMATAGTAYVQAEGVSNAAWWSSVAMGLLAVAILVANNLRDIPTDATADDARRHGERSRADPRPRRDGARPGGLRGAPCARPVGRRMTEMSRGIEGPREPASVGA
jgi:1,4-dihydroxy-2-naphthoate octaprenyltransferase